MILPIITAGPTPTDVTEKWKSGKKKEPPKIFSTLTVDFHTYCTMLAAYSAVSGISAVKRWACHYSHKERHTVDVKEEPG